MTTAVHNSFANAPKNIIKSIKKNKCILKPECESLQRSFAKANYICTNAQQSHIKSPTNRSYI